MLRQLFYRVLKIFLTESTHEFAYIKIIALELYIYLLLIYFLLLLLNAVCFNTYFKVLQNFISSVLWVVAQYSALLFGYFLTSSLINCSNGELLWNFFENWLGEKLDTNETIVKDVKNVSKEIRNSPWKG